MNILFFIPEINQQWGGIRQYSVSLLKILASDKTNTYFVFHDVNDPEVTKVLVENSHLKLVTTESIKFKQTTQIVNRVKKCVNIILRAARFKHSFKYVNNVDLICKQFSIDILHCPYQYIPETIAAKLITTLHDVQELHFPSFFSAEVRAHRATSYLDFIKRANCIVVSYKHVQNDLISFFDVPINKIHVVLLDMEKLWLDKFSDSDKVDLASLHLPPEYLFYPANTWKHKNHIGLLEALSFIRDEYGLIVNIVCSGDRNEHYYGKIRAKLLELKLDDQVKFLGVVDEKILFTLYKCAKGIVIPTLYEAGSFPLMESILLNIPVVCSSVTSLPETIKNSNYTFNPTDVKDMANKIMKIWNEQLYRESSIQNSKKIASTIKNQNAIRKFVEMYNVV